MTPSIARPVLRPSQAWSRVVTAFRVAAVLVVVLLAALVALSAERYFGVDFAIDTADVYAAP